MHRDILCDWLWPGAGEKAAARNLHVAVSTLRGVLPDEVQIDREGLTYRLALPEGAQCDVVELKTAFDACRAARARGGAGADDAIVALSSACRAYGGELLPEEGAAEWVVEPRRQYARAVADAARALAVLRIGRGDAAVAVDDCEFGLRCDPFDDRIWRLLLDAHELAGNQVARASVQRRYRERMAEMGIEVGS